MAGETRPQWLVPGAGPFTATIAPVTEGTAGALTVGSAVAVTGSLDDIEYTLRKNQANIRPMTSPRANYITIESDYDLTLVEILKKTGTNLLAGQWFGTTELFQVVFVRGAQTHTVWGISSEYQEPGGKEQRNGRLSLKPIDIGSTPVIYA